MVALFPPPPPHIFIDRNREAYAPKLSKSFEAKIYSKLKCKLGCKNFDNCRDSMTLFSYC